MKKIRKATRRKVLVTVMLVAALVIIQLASMLATTQHFTDVSRSHWAYEHIEQAYADGAMNGTGGNAAQGTGVFSPQETLTMAQFMVIVTRAFYSNEVEQALQTQSSTPWYNPYVQVALAHGLYGTTSGKSASPGPITRYDMASIMRNVLRDKGAKMPEAEELVAVQGRIADFASIPSIYKTAVETVFQMGLISGVDTKGTFSGSSYMNRAQAAVVYCRLAEKVPEVPESGSGEQVQPPAPKDVFDFKFSDYADVETFANAINAATPPYREGYLTNGEPITEENIKEFLAAIQEAIPEGITWDGDIKFRYVSPKFGGGRGCNSFGYLVSDWLFGEDAPVIEHQRFSELKVGDMVYGKNDLGSSHVYVITDIEDDGFFTSCDGNRAGQVSWNSFGMRSGFEQNLNSVAELSYIYSRF